MTCYSVPMATLSVDVIESPIAADRMWFLTAELFLETYRLCDNTATFKFFIGCMGL